MSSPFKADSERSAMDCCQPEQTATAALKDNENHTPNTAAASCPDLAISPEHNKTEEVVKIETEDIYQTNKSHTATTQNHTSNAPSPKAATVTNIPRTLDYKPPSEDVDTEMRISDLVEQVVADLADKDNAPNSTAMTGLESSIPEDHEAVMKKEVQTKVPAQSKSTDSWKSATHSKFFDQHRDDQLRDSQLRDGQLKEKQPSAAIAESKPTNDPTTSAPPKPQPAIPSDVELAARARRANAESTAVFPSPCIFFYTHSCSSFFFFSTDKALAGHKDFFAFLLPGSSASNAKK